MFTRFSCGLDPLSFDSKIYRCLPLTIPASMYEIWKLYVNNLSSYCVRMKVLTKFNCDLDNWSFDPKMYRYVSLANLHLCMKYESCTLTTSQVIVPEPKCWQSSVATLTFDRLSPKCIYVGIFHLPPRIYVSNMKPLRWLIAKLLCRKQSVDGQTGGQTDGPTNLIPIPRIAYWNTKLHEPEVASHGG